MTTSISLADADSVTLKQPQNVRFQPTQDLAASSNWVLAFAAALSGTRRGFKIGPDNRSEGWADLEVLVSSGAAFAVRPDRRFLVVDLDVAGLSSQDAFLRQAAFDRLRWAASATKIDNLVVNSGRPGHKHLILVLGSTAPSVRDAIERQCREAGLDVRSRGVRPPLAPHRSGAPSAVCGTLEDAYAVLKARSPTRAQVLSLARALGVTPLSRRMERVLREGHSVGGYESASNGRMAFALAAISSGRGRDFIRTALLDPQNALGETFRGKKPAWQEAEVERLWSLALARQETWSEPRIASRAEALERVARWNAVLDRDIWRGTSGGTDKAVCEAIGRIAYQQGGVDFSAGLSVVAVAAGVCEATARESLRRIRGRGWLRVIETHTASTATRYRLLVPECFREQAKQIEPKAPKPINASTGLPHDIAAEDDLGNDIARWNAIGKPAMLAWRALDDVTPQSTESIAAVLNISHTAARLRLRKLERYGLAARQGKMWTRQHVDQEVLAIELGTSGKQEQQVRRLLRNRQARSTLRSLWSSAFKCYRENLQNPVPSSELPGWVEESVPKRILSAWAQRLRNRGNGLT
ncbi:hypothetical protein ACF065_27560 [Streptomyces sp. NPDC015232]|uniref:hypothetical protein n=1 Tax=unclassified Streptomyces TaxID=2593676 RepID=UPI003700288E